jgi:hypothetical protein
MNERMPVRMKHLKADDARHDAASFLEEEAAVQLRLSAPQ